MYCYCHRLNIALEKLFTKSEHGDFIVRFANWFSSSTVKRKWIEYYKMRYPDRDNYPVCQVSKTRWCFYSVVLEFIRDHREDIHEFIRSSPDILNSFNTTKMSFEQDSEVKMKRTMKYTSDYLKFLYDDDDEDYNAFIVLISILNEVCQQSYETNTKMQHYTNYLCNNVKYVNEHINWVFDYLCKKRK